MQALRKHSKHFVEAGTHMHVNLSRFESYQKGKKPINNLSTECMKLSVDMETGW